MRRMLTALLLSALLFAPQPHVRAAEPPANPDPCSVGIYTSQLPPDRRPPLDVEAYFLPLVRLGSVVQPTQSAIPDSSNAVPILGFTDTLRESWYIAKDAFPGSVPIESDNPSDGSVPREILGYGWSAPAPGLARFSAGSFRRLNGLLPDIDLTENTAPPEDRVLPQRTTFAYPRFQQRLDRCSVLDTGYVDALENEHVRIEFNRIWGNAIGKMTWFIGERAYQIVLDDDIGALTQAALWHATPADTPGTCCYVNPTEAGGVDLWNYSNTTRWAGSPVLSVTTTPAPLPSVTTVVRPMNFLHTPFDGTDGATPLLWRGTFTKRVTLYGPYAELHFRARPDILPDDDPIWNMNQVFWLRANTWGDPEHIVYEVYDAATDTRTTPALPAYGSYVAVPLLPTTTAIVRTPDGTFAIGVIRGPNAVPGLELRLTRWCSDRVIDGVCPAARSILILDIHAFHAFAVDRDEAETVYITAGSDDVVSERLRYACRVLGLGCP